MSQPAELLIDTCRRQHHDRRQANLRSMLYSLVMTRRQTHRRDGHAIGYYSDWHSPAILTVALLVMLFSILDAYFTLILIGHGSTELNPILAWALEKHVYLFFLVKYSVTATCVVLTVMHRQFVVFGVKGHHILFGCLLCYALLVHYQLSMLVNIWF